MNAVELAEWLWLLVAALGLNLSVGLAGQPMLGQGAAVAAGSYGVVLLADRAGLPLGVAAAIAVAATGLVGWLVDLGAARLRGPYLALGTWALAWLAYASLTAFPATFGGSQGLQREVPARLVSPALGAVIRLTPVRHVLLALTLCLLVLLATWWVRRSPVGLDLAALREDPVAAASLGVPVAALRRNALAAATALGALAGVGRVTLLGLVAPGDVSPLLSIQLLVAVLLGGGTLLGPVAGVAILATLPGAADRFAQAAGIGVEQARGVVTAVLLVAVLAAREPVVRRLRAATARRHGRSPAAPAASASARPGAIPRVVLDDGTPALVAAGLRRDFGAVRALDGVDLTVDHGEVHALIGPNGSGKTTALRVLAGSLPASGGTVVVGGRDVTALGQQARVRAGVARTFQRTVLLPGLSVADQVAAGARVTEAGGRALPALLATPNARERHRSAGNEVRSVLEDTGLAAHSHRRPAALTHGQQRTLQVARAVATGARVLLLDEPAAGMTADEVDVLAAEIRRLAGNGVGVLLVEHDIRFVASVADRVTVLAEGRVLATGTPDEVVREPAVRRAYLGGRHLEEIS
jgi:branched-chain amino acid transport system permease protein